MKMSKGGPLIPNTAGKMAKKSKGGSMMKKSKGGAMNKKSKR